MNTADASLLPLAGIHVSVRPGIQERERQPDAKGKPRKSFIVKWRVAGADKSRAFPRRAAAEAFQRDLHNAKDRPGASFDARSGLPLTLLAPCKPVTVVELACQVVADGWPAWSPGNRRARVEALAQLASVLVLDGKARPSREVLRRVLRDHLLLPEEERRPLTSIEVADTELDRGALVAASRWLELNSRPASDLASLALVERTLRLVSVRQDGKTYSGDTLQRQRTALSMVCRAAVRDGHLPRNPVGEVSRKALIEDEAEEVDPGRVPSPEEARALVEGVRNVSATSWQYAAFLTLRWTTGMRPSEASGIRNNKDLFLPTDKNQWGRVVLRTPTVHVSARWTGTGEAHADRPKLKARRRGATRTVLLPPEAVEALKDHIARRGVKPGARVFTNSKGAPLDWSAMGKVWRLARVRAFPDGRFADLTLYELRHASVGMMLRAGVPVPKIADCVGNSPGTLMRVYARVMATDDESFMSLVSSALAQ